MRCPDPRRASAGFTLIEVLGALAIAGLILAAAASIFGTGAIGHQTAADADMALALAQEKIAGAEASSSVRPGTIGGTYAGRFDWQVSVGPYEEKEKDKDKNRNADAAAPPDWPNAVTLALYRIQASVAWRDGRRHRQLVLSTLRLLPAPPP